MYTLQVKEWFSFDILQELDLDKVFNETEAFGEALVGIKNELDVIVNWIVDNSSLLTQLLALTLLLLLIEAYIYLKGLVPLHIST